MQPGDTLWEIARDIKSEDVSVQSTLTTLHRANPDAFIDENINRLKVGAMLAVPDFIDADIERAPRAAAAMAQGGTYGPVAPGDTLWWIAKAVQADGVSFQSTLTALHSANPHAFINNNIDRLKTDVILTVPNLLAGQVEAVRTTLPSEPGSDEVFEAQILPKPDETYIAPIYVTPATSTELVTALPDSAPEIEADSSIATIEETESPAQAHQVVAELAPSVFPPQRGQENLSAVVEPQIEVPVSVERESSAPPPTKAASPTSTTAPELASVDPSSKPKSTFNPVVVIELGAIILLLVTIALLFALRTRREVRVERIRHEDRRNEEARRKQLVIEKAEQRVALEAERSASKQPVETTNTPAEAPAAQDEQSSVNAKSVAPGESAIGEIERHIASGQYNLAEQVALDIIDDTPRNHHAKLKLAELYFMIERVNDFVRIADDLHNNHRAFISGEDWDRLIHMGKQIGADHPLFTGPQQVDFDITKP